MFGVVDAAEVAGDDDGHAVGRPQFVRPAVGVGTLDQQAFPPAEVGVGQSGGGSGRRFGGESVGSAGGAGPAGDGVRVDAEDGGDGLAGLALGEGADGLPAAAFQFVRGSVRPAHDTWRAEDSRRIH